MEREEEKAHKQRMKEETKIQKETQRQISDLNRAMQTHAQIKDEIQSQIQELQKFRRIYLYFFWQLIQLIRTR